MPSEFDNTNQLTEGADPSGTWGAYATLLLQMIRQATPGSLYGFIIESEETPPVTGSDSWRKRCLWKKISTQRLYYYNNDAGSWDNLENLFPDMGVPDDGSVSLAKIDAAGAARYVLRIDSGGVALEFVAPADLFNAGEIPLTKLPGVGTSGAGYVIYSTDDGTWGVKNFAVALDDKLVAATIPSDRVFDLSGDGAAGQVYTKAAAGTGHEYRDVEDLIDANTLSPDKVDWSTIPVGNLVKRATTGNTIADGGTIASLQYTPKEAMLKDVQPNNTAGQSVGIGVLTKLRLNTEIDPQSFVTFDDTQDTFQLAAGTYRIIATVPLEESTSGPRGVVALYNETTAAVVATASQNTGGDQDSTTINLMHIFTIASATTYSLRVHVSGATTNIGTPRNFGYEETYTQILLCKLA